MPYLGQRPSKGDENNFKILDDISSYTLTFDGSDSSVVSAANDTITSLTHRFVQGQRVTYNKGGGTVIAGLSDGVYYIIKEDHNTIKLATSASNATDGIAVNITGVGAGSSHTLNVAFDGINTKFKATHTNGQKARITRSAQLVISINGVIQQPHDTATPSTGFGFDLDGTIVFSQAPVSTDEYWAHVLTNNNVSFEISDNDIDNFTGDGSTTEFNLSKSPPDNRNILVTIDGVVQYPNDPDGTARAYVVVENVLTFNSAPASGVEIQVRHIGFAGSTSGSGGVTSFYGRTGAVVLKNTDNIVANNAEFAGNLTVQGTMTTLDTVLTEVDKLEVGANNTSYAGIITQTGSGNILGLFDGSTEVFTVKDDGRVLIGTTTEGAGGADELTIANTSSSSGITIRSSTTATGNIYFSDGTSGTNQYRGVVRYDHNDNYMSLWSNASERLRITSGGNIGIGTTNPQEKLHIHDGNIVIGQVSGNNTNTRNYIKFGRVSAPKAAIGFINSTGNGRGDIIFMNNDDINAASFSNSDEVFRITHDGNVGIGTTSPEEKLDVRGHIKLDSGPVLQNSTSSGDVLNITSATGYLELGSKNASYSHFHTDRSKYYFNKRIIVDEGIIGSYNEDLVLATNISEERIRIKNDTGFVGIGTDNPDQTLHVFHSTANNIALFESGDAFATMGLSDSNGSISFLTTLGGLRINVNGDAGTIGDNSTLAMGIKNNGYVGIGTDNPDDLLELVGTDPVLKLHDITGGATHGLKLKHDGTEGELKLQSAGLLKIIQNNGGSNGITFHTNSAEKERLRITGGGLVGVGTTNPSQRFTVEGNGNATGGILVQNVVYGNNQNRPYLTVGTSNWDGSTTNWGTHGFQHRIKSNSGGSARITIDSLVSGSTKEIISISSGGRVGLGTDNAKGNLHVRGSDHDGLISALDIDGATEYGSIGVNMYRNNSDSSSNHTGWSKANNLRTGAAIEFETHTNAYASSINFYLAAKGPYSNSNWYKQPIGIWDSTGLIISNERNATTTSRGNNALYVTNNSSTETARFYCSAAGNTKIHIECSTNTGDSELHFCDQADRTGGGALHHESSSGEIVYEHDNDAFRFNTNKTEKLRIASDGKVGIGTNNPRANLLHLFKGASGHDYGTTGHLILENDDGNTIQMLVPNTAASTILFGDNDNGMVGRIKYDHTNNRMSFWTQNNQRMTLDGNNLGIGITNPGYRLEIGNVLSNNNIKIGNRITDSDYGIAYGYYDNLGGDHGFGIDMKHGGTLTINAFVVSAATGNIGIGKTNPQGKLHLSSGTSGDCVLILESDTDNNQEHDNPYIKFVQDGGIEESVIGMDPYDLDSDNNALVLANSVANANGIIFKTGTVNGYTNATERLRITPAGLVGIGTNNPLTDLHVKKDSTVVRFQSTNNATSARLEIIGANDSYSGLHMGDIDDVDIGAIRYYHGGSAPNHMIFYTNADDKMRIDDSGRVRIGSNSDTEYSISNDSNAILQLSHASGPKIILTRVDGSVSGNDYLGVIDFHSTDPSINLCSRIAVTSSQSHTSTARGTDFRFLTTKNGTTTQREVMRINDSGALTLNSTGTSNSAVLYINTVEGSGSENRHTTANQTTYTIYNNSHFTGAGTTSSVGIDTITGNRTKAGFRNDVECGIYTGTSKSGSRVAFYGIHNTATSSKFVYHTLGSYNLAQLTTHATNQSLNNSSIVTGVYGYAQGYPYGGSRVGAGKTCTIYGGFFLGYRGGDVNSGHCHGVYGKALNNNHYGNLGDMTGVYAECEQDHSTTIGNAYAFRGVIDRDGGTITNSYILHGNWDTTTNCTNRYGVYILNSTDNLLTGDLTITGSLSKGAGLFKIPHPLVGLSTTKDLVHSFIEGPQMDLIYRGKVTLSSGAATVNLDTVSNMTEGTFVALNRDVQCFTTNETGWTAVKGSVTGNQLTIIAQENTCTDTISWMVIGERQDETVKSLDLTDNDGNLIVEPDKKPIVETPVEDDVEPVEPDEIDKEE